MTVAPIESVAMGENLVFISHRDNTCAKCRKPMEAGVMICLVPPDGALCLSCCGLEELVFLPRGDAALTRRAVKASAQSAVVLKWSRSRKRNERQGILVTAEALAAARGVCANDEAKRAAQRAKAAVRREKTELDYVGRFAARIRELFPACPEGEEQKIAEHTCRKYSGRIGRSSMAKELAAPAIELAVGAYIRHAHTGYDTFLAKGWSRDEARTKVAAKIDRVRQAWRGAAK